MLTLIGAALGTVIAGAILWLIWAGRPARIVVRGRTVEIYGRAPAAEVAQEIDRYVEDAAQYLEKHHPDRKYPEERVLALLPRRVELVPRLFVAHAPPGIFTNYPASEVGRCNSELLQISYGAHIQFVGKDGQEHYVEIPTVRSSMLYEELVHGLCGILYGDPDLLRIKSVWKELLD